MLPVRYSRLNALLLLVTKIPSSFILQGYTDLVEFLIKSGGSIGLTKKKKKKKQYLFFLHQME